MSTKSKSFNQTKTADREAGARHSFKKRNPSTRRELANDQDIEPGSISAAVNNMLARGEVVERGTKHDPETGRHVALLYYVGPKDDVETEKPKKVNKSWKISSLELENEQLKKRLSAADSRINLLVGILRFISGREAAVNQLIKEFHETQIKIQSHE